MPINPNTYQKAEALLITMSHSDKLIKASGHMDEIYKNLYWVQNQRLSNVIRNGFQLDRLSAYNIRICEVEFFKFWGFEVRLDVEKLWWWIDKEQLDFGRKSPLQNLLHTKRFDTEQWIGLHNSMSSFKKSSTFRKVMRPNEIQLIEKLLKAKTEEYYKNVKRCLGKRPISNTTFFKLSPSMAFLERANLTSHYFTEKEKEEIYKIWQGYKIVLT